MWGQYLCTKLVMLNIIKTFVQTHLLGKAIVEARWKCINNSCPRYLIFDLIQKSIPLCWSKLEKRGEQILERGKMVKKKKPISMRTMSSHSHPHSTCWLIGSQATFSRKSQIEIRLVQHPSNKDWYASIFYVMQICITITVLLNL